MSAISVTSVADDEALSYEGALPARYQHIWKEDTMRIVITHPITHDTFPTNSCLFCGYPIHQLGIACIDDTARGKVRGLVCTACVQREPMYLQAALSEKASRLRSQAAMIRGQADSVLAQAEALERSVQPPIQMPPVDDIDRIGTGQTQSAICNLQLH
jgi:hypothetical protein